MHVDYFLAPQSPWAYLGHARFANLLQVHQATVSVRPMDLGRIFPLTGGLPLPQRAPQRQAYRLVELERFARWLQVPLTLHPRFFPVPGDAAARLLVAVQQHDGPAAALGLAGRVLAAVWAEERNIADATTLRALLAEAALPAERLEQAGAAEVQARYEQHTQAALDAGVFGAPSYVIDGEVFWGQDRLDFVARRLGGAHPAS